MAEDKKISLFGGASSILKLGDDKKDEDHSDEDFGDDVKERPESEMNHMQEGDYMIHVSAWLRLIGCFLPSGLVGELRYDREGAVCSKRWTRLLTRAPLCTGLHHEWKELQIGGKVSQVSPLINSLTRYEKVAHFPKIWAFDHSIA